MAFQDLEKDIDQAAAERFDYRANLVGLAVFVSLSALALGYGAYQFYRTVQPQLWLFGAVSLIFALMAGLCLYNISHYRNKKGRE